MKQNFQIKLFSFWLKMFYSSCTIMSVKQVTITASSASLFLPCVLPFCVKQNRAKNKQNKYINK